MVRHVGARPGPGPEDGDAEWPASFAGVTRCNQYADKALKQFQRHSFRKDWGSRGPDLDL